MSCIMLFIVNKGPGVQNLTIFWLNEDFYVLFFMNFLQVEKQLIF